MSSHAWIVPDWPAPPGVRALITTRAGGASRGAYAGLNLGLNSGDAAETVARNRASLRPWLPAEPLWLCQVHGTAVVEADSAEGNPEADAAIARRPRQVCAVLTADCLPLLLCEEDGSIVAAVHAGWRGLCAGVIEQALRAMDRPPQALLAYLGPAIGSAAYEVGAEVRAAFLAADAQSEGGFAPGNLASSTPTCMRSRAGASRAAACPGFTAAAIAPIASASAFTPIAATAPPGAWRA